MATTKILFYSSTFYKKENKTAHSAVDKTCDVRWEAGNEDGPSSVKVVFKYIVSSVYDIAPLVDSLIKGRVSLPFWLFWGICIHLYI